MMANHRLRILHISDLHERGTRENATWRRQRVLGPEWTANLAEIVKDGRIDLVCFTGDLADRGDKTEYNATTSFLDALLEALGLPRERFFAVPGNHDIARTVAKPEWDRLRQHHADMREIELSEWILGRANVPRGFSASDDAAILQREAAFWTWLCEDFGRAELHPSKSPHGRLGYRVQAQVGDLPFPVQIVGLDSAWAAGDNHDSQHLLLTSDQVGRLLTDNGSPLPGFRLGLVHHPLSQLADAADVTPQLANGLDLLLRGHQHREALEQWADPNFKLRMYAAGCLYDGHDKDQWPNAFHVIDLQLDGSGRPLRGEVRFRGWSSTGHWHDDNSRYAGTHHGRLAISWVPEVRPSVPPPPVFVGREHELAMLEATLLPVSGAPGVAAICAVQGMPGVGKSYLADEFAARHTQQFPGGYIRLVLGPADLRTADELIAALGQQLDPPFQGADVLVRLVYRLQHPRTLVHIENVDTQETAVEVAKVVRQLQHCCIVLSGRIANFGAGAGWRQIPLANFDAATAMKQLRQELGLSETAPDPIGTDDLLHALGYLPLAIHLAASHLREGATPGGFLAALKKSGLALRPRDAADRGLTIDESRAILSKAFELSLDALRTEGGADGEKLVQAYAALAHAAPAGFGRSLGAAVAGLDEGEFEQLLMAANRLSLLVKVEQSAQTDGAWRLHPLLADFLRPRVPVAGVVARMTEWFCARLPAAEPGHEAEQGVRWAAVHREVAGLVHWLPLVPDSGLEEVVYLGSHYARLCGPFRPWLTFCARTGHAAFDHVQRSNVLWTLANVARQLGDMRSALDAAAGKRELDAAAGRERGVAIAWGLEADILQDRGQIDDALHIRQYEELPVYERLGDVHSKAATMGRIADILQDRGEVDEALRIRQAEELPVYEQLGDVREKAVTMGKIADLLHARGQVDEALRIRQEEQVPVFKRLGEVRSKAVTMGKIADILQARGQFDDALRIRQGEELPVYEQLGDAREKAVTMGKVADILHARGQIDEALRIRQVEQLPVYERLGDVREIAVTMGKIADILYDRGYLDEALRIRQEEELPVYERLDHSRSKAVTKGKIADILQAQGQVDEALRIRQEDQLPVYERLGDVREKAVTMGKIADILQARGRLDDALRIRQQEEVPVYERLGDVRSRAVTMCKIADILQARGQVDEALRILQAESLPLFERLGDLRSKAVTMAKVADILHGRGQVDEALRILREDLVPAFEGLGDVRSMSGTMCMIADILAARGQADEALRILTRELVPVFERLGDVWSKAVTMGKIADILQTRGQIAEALHIRQEEELSVYQRLGDVRSKAVTMGKIADILRSRGQVTEALRIYQEEQLPVFVLLGLVREKAMTMGKIADILQARGQFDEALHIRQEEELPVYERLGDVRSKAVAMGQIASILTARGQVDEALRILQEEVVPVFGRLGDVRSKAMTMGMIAGILRARGNVDGALRILQEELVPAFGSLGDARAKAMTMGMIADILLASGQFEEALRIREEEQVPVFERLGEVREKAVTMGHIAAILQARGQFDEALLIRRQEELPVYERLGDVRSLVIGRTNAAIALAQRARPEDGPEIATLLVQAHTAAVEMRLPEAAQIEQLYLAIFGTPLPN